MFGDRIKYLRVQKKLTQEELGGIFHVTKGTICMWETNKRIPDSETIKHLADFFNVSMDSLFKEKNIDVTILPQGGKAERLELTQEDIETIKKLTELFKKK